jgi:hypothetical protein
MALSLVKLTDELLGPGVVFEDQVDIDSTFQQVFIDFISEINEFRQMGLKILSKKTNTNEALLFYIRKFREYNDGGPFSIIINQDKNYVSVSQKNGSMMFNKVGKPVYIERYQLDGLNYGIFCFYLYCASRFVFGKEINLAKVLIRPPSPVKTVSLKEIKDVFGSSLITNLRVYSLAASPNYYQNRENYDSPFGYDELQEMSDFAVDVLWVLKLIMDMYSKYQNEIYGQTRFSWRKLPTVTPENKWKEEIKPSFIQDKFEEMNKKLSPFDLTDKSGFYTISGIMDILENVFGIKYQTPQTKLQYFVSCDAQLRMMYGVERCSDCDSLKQKTELRRQSSLSTAATEE